MTTSGPDGSPQRLAIDDLDSLRAGIVVFTMYWHDQGHASGRRERSGERAGLVKDVSEGVA